MKKASEVMTKNPVFCLSNDMAVKAAKLMKSENVGSIPVVDNEQTQELIGILTDRDLVMKIVAEGLDAASTQIEVVMTHKVVTCLADDDLQKVMDTMSKNQLRRIPVINENKKILGMISQADVAIHYDHPKRTAAMVKEISKENTK
jgi:CBS domain-containing protein